MPDEEIGTAQNGEKMSDSRSSKNTGEKYSTKKNKSNYDGNNTSEKNSTRSYESASELTSSNVEGGKVQKADPRPYVSTCLRRALECPYTVRVTPAARERARIWLKNHQKEVLHLHI